MKTFIKRLAKLTETIEILKVDMETKLDQKREIYENKSEHWQDSDNGQIFEENMDRMQECIDELQNAYDYISDFAN